MLPLLLVFFLVIFPLQRHYFPHTADNKFGVFFGVFASAFAVGVCIVEFSLRPFFPLRRAVLFARHFSEIKPLYGCSSTERLRRFRAFLEAPT
jgi:hypothetical protein